MLTRRAALKGGTAVATCAAVITAAGAVAIPAFAVEPEDPILALRNERDRLIAAINGFPNTVEGDEMGDEFSDDLIEIEARILEIEPRTLAGALAQVEQLALWHQGGLTYRGDETIEPLIKALPERIGRLAGRAQS